jgi:hypothetical protein
VTHRLLLHSLRLCRWRLFVTFKTFNLSVFASQGVARELVIEIRNLPAAFTVASQTLTVLEFLRQIFSVLVFVARKAILLQTRELKEAESLFLNGRRLLMALEAFQLKVFSSQRIAGLFVIKFWNLPIRFGVALKALTPALKLMAKILRVLIGVAGQALRLLEVRPLVMNGLLRLRSSMAIEALELKMLSLQLITRVLLVFEFNIKLPLLESVAGIAILLRIFAGEEMHVVFFVATDARRLFAQKTRVSFSKIFVRSFRLMALHTVDLRVLAFQNVAGLCVVERFEIKFRRIVSPTFVLGMTLDASLLREPVKSFFYFDKLRDVFVAAQTKSFVDTFPRVVALQAVIALKILMPSHQRSRRKHTIHDAFAFFASDI